MEVLKTCFLFACSFNYIYGSGIVKRRTGDQAPSGNCAYFNRGGTSRWHFYVCCNNCQDSDRSCDGRTYHTASSKSYCDTCGKDNSEGDGRLKSTFYCGGCRGQNAVYDICAKWYNKIPGLCWLFTGCFRDKCSKYKQSVTRALTDTCFDGKCQDGETIENCPVDCCANINEECVQRGNECKPECCGTSSCCITDSDNEQDTETSSNIGNLFAMSPYSCLLLSLGFCLKMF